MLLFGKSYTILKTTELHHKLLLVLLLPSYSPLMVTMVDCVIKL